MPSSRLKNWNTMPMWRRRMIASSSSVLPTSDSPARRSSPSVGVSRPATRLSSVDLPQPDGPITATNSPGVIVKSTPRSARTGAPSDSNVLRSPCVYHGTGSRPSSDAPLSGHRSSSSCAIRSMSSNTSMRYARTGVFRPFTVCSSSGTDVDVGVQRRVRALVDHDAARRPSQVLQPLREVHGVADERVLEPLLGAEQRGGDRPGRQADAEAERRRALRSATAR